MFDKKDGTLYTGSTYDLVSRIWQHKQQLLPGCFTAKYSINKLGYYEVCSDLENALLREKQIKAGSRTDKIQLILSKNPRWRDLYSDIVV